MARLVISRYSGALFDIAKEDNKLDLFLEDANLLCEIIDDTNFSPVINSSLIEKNIRKELVKKILDNKIQKEFIDFILLLIEKNRIIFLKDIINEFIRLIKEELLIGVAYITSYYELDDNTKEKIRNKILNSTKYKIIEDHYIVDKKIIGGLKIEINNYIYDDTINSKIINLKKKLLFT